MSYNYFICNNIKVMADISTELKITEDEAKVYDRQIRLWGLDAQKRIRSAKILIAGMGGLGAEICKNIVLAGVKLAHLIDNVQVSEKDFKNQFLLRREDINKNRAESSIKQVQLLNPCVEIISENCDVGQKPDDFFSNFDVVCLIDMEWSTISHLNKVCREKGIKFFAGGVFGFYGYSFSDLGSHHFAEDVIQKKNKSTGPSAEKKLKLDEDSENKTVKKHIEFFSFDSVLNFNWSKKENLPRLEKTPAGFFICKVLSEFLSKNKRLPDSLENIENDQKELLQIRQKVLESLQIKSQFIPEAFIDHCFDQESAVCAVTGGIIAQEIIKAVSMKDHPHNNFFFFDGLEACGLVDLIGE